MDTLVENGTLLLSCIIVARFDDHARLLTEERSKACKRGGKQDANTVILTTVASGLIKARFVYAHKVVASTCTFSALYSLEITQTRGGSRLRRLERRGNRFPRNFSIVPMLIPFFDLYSFYDVLIIILDRFEIQIVIFKCSFITSNCEYKIEKKVIIEGKK